MRRSVGGKSTIRSRWRCAPPRSSDRRGWAECRSRNDRPVGADAPRRSGDGSAQSGDQPGSCVVSRSLNGDSPAQAGAVPRRSAGPGLAGWRTCGRERDGNGRTSPVDGTCLARVRIYVKHYFLLNQEIFLSNITRRMRADPQEHQDSGVTGVKTLPLPLWEADGGRGGCRGRTAASCASTPPPNRLPQGEGESLTPRPTSRPPPAFGAGFTARRFRPSLRHVRKAGFRR